MENADDGHASHLGGEFAQLFYHDDAMDGTTHDEPNPALTTCEVDGKLENAAVDKELESEARTRLVLADRAQQIHFLAYQLECDVADLGLWTEARIIPHSWRLGIQRHVAPLLQRLVAHMAKLVEIESYLLPPFKPQLLKQYEVQLQVTEDFALFLFDCIQECKDRAIKAEQTVAAIMIQSHYRRILRERGFYTTKITLTRLQRGLIPGLFDGLKTETTMKVSADRIVLEYPKALDTSRLVAGKNGARMHSSNQ
ncbi:unnamed protein product [Aphanomyces euteiches]